MVMELPFGVLFSPSKSQELKSSRSVVLMHVVWERLVCVGRVPVGWRGFVCNQNKLQRIKTSVSSAFCLKQE